MKRFLALVVLVMAGGVALAAGVKSGPQTGDKVPGPFEPFNITGPAAGEESCLFCRFSGCPTAVVFAREITPEVTKLIKQLDEANGKNKAADMGSYVVFLTKDASIKNSAKELASKQGLKHIILSTMDPAGPKGYEIAQEADVTVLLYSKNTVRANHAFKKGELNDKFISTIVSDVEKIVK